MKKIFFFTNDMGFASGSAVELSSAAMQEMEARDMGSIPASGKSRERK